MSCTTDWTFELKPGGSAIYDSDSAYDAADIDGLPNYYDRTGDATTWFFEDPIDGCLAEQATFMDGQALLLMDGTQMSYN